MQMISDVPEHYLAEAFRIIKINESEVFKKYCLKHSSKTVCRDFILYLFGADRAVVEALYRRIEGVLFVFGCAPSLGIAFNLIDACFCFMLQNWLGMVVAILSCFPIPGFKAAGKGLEKFLTIVIKKITPSELSNRFLRLILKRMELLKNIVNNNPYETIQKMVKKYVPELNNPFAEEVMMKLGNTIKLFGPRLEEKTISNSVKLTREVGLLDIMKAKSRSML